MARYRMVYVEIWDDPDFQAYKPDAKLVFIYLFTNYKIGDSGIYVITPETISRHTGIRKNKVEAMIRPLGEYGRCEGLKNVFYDPESSAIFIAKYRVYNPGGNPKIVAKSIENERGKVKTFLWSLFDKYYSREGQPLANGYIALDIDIDLGIELENRSVSEKDAEDYFYNKLGGVANRMLSVVKDFVRLRKSKAMAPSVLIKITDEWVKYPENLLLEAKRIWDEKHYAAEGKGEKYFNGILRQLKKEFETRKAGQVGAC